MTESALCFRLIIPRDLYESKHDRTTMTQRLTLRNVAQRDEATSLFLVFFPSTLDPIATLSGSSYPLCHASVIPRSGRSLARSLASFPRSVAREKAYRRYIAWASAWRRDHALICTVISGTRGESNLFHAAQGQWCDLTTPRSPRRSSDNTLAAIGHTASASKTRAPS